MPGLQKNEKLSTMPGSDLRQLEIQYNNAVRDLAQIQASLCADLVLAWQTAAANSGQAIGRGSTDTAIASGKFGFTVAGIPETKAAVTNGTAIGGQTVPADTWASYALDIATGGTITVSAAAANATTGYATEALAIAAVPVRVTAKARMGYITVLTKAATAWIAGTDALAGGSSGNPATTTNYYPFDGIYCPTGTATTCQPDGAWIGGRNGPMIATVLSRGSSDTNLAYTAFTYNARGIANIAKTASTSGAALGALGTIPADKWGAIAVFISSTGTISFLWAPGNSTGDYTYEWQAQGALPLMTPTANLAQIGYFTVKTKSATAWIAGTDALAGGSSGNPASATNYYPQAGITPSVGMSAAFIANRQGVVLTSVNY